MAKGKRQEELDRERPCLAFKSGFQAWATTLTEHWGLDPEPNAWTLRC